MGCPRNRVNSTLIDRLVHHAEILTIDGDSYRRRVAEAKRKASRPPAEA
jgi:DNA replication protein DnaC